MSTESDISPDFPFKANYLDVLGSKMHYVEVGTGDPILLLHGNPTWSYLWRNIIPHLEPLGRCIAPDLIGYGRSDKPPIEYHWTDHARYLDAFIQEMGLRDVTLVLHDQGSALGFDYASRHEEDIRALAFFEAIIRPFPWDQFSTPDFRDLFRAFRTGGVGGQGWQMIVVQNMFIDQLLPEAAGRPLSAEEMAYYREPFLDPLSRIPIWRFPRETAIGGEPEEVFEIVSRYSEWLQKTKLPKLLLHALPGALITEENFKWAQENIQGLDSVFLGEGSHFLQESSPHRIGKEIAAWIEKLPAIAGRSASQTASSPSAPSAPAGRGAQAGGGDTPPPFPPPPTANPPSARAQQAAIDEAAVFDLISVPAAGGSNGALREGGKVVGMRIDETLHRFQIDSRAPTASEPVRSINRVGEPIASFRQRWMFIPHDFVAVPGRQPPPTAFDPTRAQRFAMLDGECTFEGGKDGFRGFGTGTTLPATGGGPLQAMTVGTILEGFGRFAGHEEGTYLHIGTLDVERGFTGNVLLRVVDPQGTLLTSRSLPSLRPVPSPEPGITYAFLRGEAIPSDPVSPYIGPDGRPIGLIVEQGLRLQVVDASARGQLGVRTTSSVGRSIGRITAKVVFNPAAAAGTLLDPLPFTADDEFVFVDDAGKQIGSFTADSSDGRVFNTKVLEQPGIRFGGVGRIRGGTGPFEGIDGLMSDNSVVVFTPHVSASVYILRINDPDGRFNAALG